MCYTGKCKYEAMGVFAGDCIIQDRQRPNDAHCVMGEDASTEEGNYEDEECTLF